MRHYFFPQFEAGREADAATTVNESNGFGGVPNRWQGV